MTGRPRLDLTGIRMGKLVVESPTEGRLHKSIIWRLRCDCGGVRLESAAWIKKRIKVPYTVSCGCDNYLHGMSETPTYGSWRKMLARTRHKEYIHHYGFVTVCDEWDTWKGGSFENFYRDMGDRPEGTSLNRINGSSIYSKETCEWADATLQIYDQCRRSDNTSGKTGVQKCGKNKWLASITKKGVTVKLYYGDSLEEAIAAREKAEIELYGFMTKTVQTHVRNNP